MEFYQPSQFLNFLYVKTTNTLYLKSSVQVLVAREEDLASHTDFPEGSSQSRITLNVVHDALQTDINVNMPQILMQLFKTTPKIPSDIANDEIKLKEALRRIITTDLKSKSVSYYTVTANVIKSDGSSGGSVTTTTSQNGDIEIVL